MLQHFCMKRNVLIIEENSYQEFLRFSTCMLTLYILIDLLFYFMWHFIKLLQKWILLWLFEWSKAAVCLFSLVYYQTHQPVKQDLKLFTISNQEPMMRQLFYLAFYWCTSLIFNQWPGSIYIGHLVGASLIHDCVYWWKCIND